MRIERPAVFYWKRKAPVPTDEEYYGQKASQASLTLMEERGLDDPMQSQCSLLLPAENDLEPLRNVTAKVAKIQMFMLCSIVFLIVMVLVVGYFDEVKHVPILGPLSPVFMLFGVGGIIFLYGANAWLNRYVRQRHAVYMREARVKWEDENPSLQKFSVYIDHPWMYHHGKSHCDWGVAIFDPANHMMVIEGLRYRYFVCKDDMTKIKYLKTWESSKNVAITVMMNDVPFEMVLSRYTIREDLRDLCLPLVKPRLTMLMQETFGEFCGSQAPDK